MIFHEMMNVLLMMKVLLIIFFKDLLIHFLSIPGETKYNSSKNT